LLLCPVGLVKATKGYPLVVRDRTPDGEGKEVTGIFEVKGSNPSLICLLLRREFGFHLPLGEPPIVVLVPLGIRTVCLRLFVLRLIEDAEVHNGYSSVLINKSSRTTDE
jgi:hypothetical protein